MPDPVDDWHVYALEWSPDELSFEVDGDVTCVLDDAVPSTAKFLLINTAVGGVGGGEIDAVLDAGRPVDRLRQRASRRLMVPERASIPSASAERVAAERE